MKPKPCVTLYGMLFLLAFVLEACGAPTPIPETPTPIPSISATVTPLPLPTATPTPAPEVADAIIVGLLQDWEPDTLWPLWGATPKQQVIQRAVMEPPMTTLNYDYQAVLLEEVPTIENGGAVLQQVPVPIDASGAVTVTDTGVYTIGHQLVVTFHLRADLYWSDGQPVRASDSVFGFNVACASEVGLDLERCARVARYEALDERTIRVTFRPNTFAPDYYAYCWPFLPEHAWSRYTPEEMASVEQVSRFLSPSYGPYMIAEWKPHTSITLVRNPHYVLHGLGYPVVPKIIFKFLPDPEHLLAELLAGQLDLVESHGLQGLDPDLLQALEERGLIRLYTVPSPVWEHIDMNLNDPADLTQPHPILSDLRVRQAIAYGTDRERMAQEIYQGKVAVMNSWIPAEHWAYAGDEALTLYPYDPNRAAALLEEAGWILADDGFRYKDGARLSLSLDVLSGQPQREQIAERLRADMAALGMELKIVRVPEKTWFGEQSPLTRRAFDLIVYAWIPGLEPDGWANYACDQIPSESNGWQGQNYMGWCNGAATSALAQLDRKLKREDRKALYRLIQQQFTADMPSLPLFSQLEVFAAKPALRNVRFNPTERFTWNCWEWSLPVQRP
jgi:peptide/nickel transport system substrate-binding protein